MKKLLLSLSALVIFTLPKASAQVIPNLGLETWTANSDNAGSAPDPNTGLGSSGWWDFNVVSNALLGASPLTVLEGTTAPAPQSGSHYAVIVSEAMTHTSYTDLTPYGFVYPDTNGLMFLGNVNVVGASVSLKSGVPYGGGRSPSYSFYYRYVPNGVDTASCLIAMYHYSSVTHTRDLIGGALWTCHTTTTSWTKATVPILYDSATSVPDTVFVEYSACSVHHTIATGPKLHDTLDIDNASIVLGEANIAEQHDNVSLYPNPANSQINFAVSGQFQASKVEIYDMTGRTMGTYSMNNNFLTINTQAYKSGMYFYKLLDITGAQLNVGKFSVVK